MRILSGVDRKKSLTVCGIYLQGLCAVQHALLKVTQFDVACSEVIQTGHAFLQEQMNQFSRSSSTIIELHKQEEDSRAFLKANIERGANIM
jgi:hypothetical protein